MQFSGLYTPLATPFLDDEIDEAGLRANVRRYLTTPLTDTILQWIKRLEASKEPPPAEEEAVKFPITSWKLTTAQERLRFKAEFGETLWAFLGSNTLSPLDTMRTLELRARLEAAFGPPTQTLAERSHSETLTREDYTQFEYWFVLNDSIPLVVMDVNGPLERGVIVTTNQLYRDILSNIRSAFLGQLVASDARKPFVDYYYHYDQGIWYRSGYDGLRFFQERIRSPDFSEGRPELYR
jgi:hypothetical protein